MWSMKEETLSKTSSFGILLNLTNNNLQLKVSYEELEVMGNMIDSL